MESQLHSKKIISLILLATIALSQILAETPKGFRIDEVEYDIVGNTRKFPLSQKVEIDRIKVYATQEEFKAYIADLEILFLNVRVLESAKIDAQYGTVGSDGIVPVKLIVHTVDTWNIIGFPYPKFDSNSGTELKLKLKNYNFFGSMEPMNADVIFAVDNNGRKEFESNFSFAIPFEYKGQTFKWDIDATLTMPFNEVPEFELSTGLDYKLPLGFADLHFGVEQGLTMNPRDSDDKLQDDSYYLSETVYTKLPTTIYEFDYFGKLMWTPRLSINQQWNPSGVKDPDLTGPDFVVSHSLSIGRVDWVGNFRHGAEASVGNSYVYDFYQKNNWDISVSGEVSGFASVFDRVGISSRVKGFYNFDNDVSDDVGDDVRGILDRRISTDTMISLNVDLPVRILRVNFEEISGVEWTRYVSFDMHFSPFFDMAITHDQFTGRYYAFEDGWYAGGFEIIVYPLKMRSIYFRASIGWDLSAVIETGELRGNSSRDDEGIHEQSVGIGLHY